MAAGGDRPNLLLIMTDQLRHDCVGYRGLCNVGTPNLDALAGRGVRFDYAFSAIPTCCPARQALLNTRRPESFGGYWNYDITFPVRSLDPGEYAWPRELQRAGYRSAFVGKWHVNPDHGPEEYGYDSFYGVGDYGTYFESIPGRRSYTNAWRGEADVVPLEQSRTHVLASRAAERIREFAASAAPWHVRIDFPEPHLPCRPAGRFADMYSAADIAPWGNFGDRLDGKPYIQRKQLVSWGVENYTWENWAPIVARYFGAISQVDDAIGRLMGVLDETGQAENTIVAFTSDHGDLCGAHGMVDKHYVMYDEVVRVPLLIADPSLPAGRRGVVSNSFVSATLDLGPTLLDLLGLPAPQETHGRSLRAQMEGRVVAYDDGEIVATYNGAQFGLYCQRMIRTRRWKYVWNLTEVDELYDLENDPCERENRIEDPALETQRRRLAARLFTVLQQDGDPLCTGPWNRGQLLAEKTLESLDIPQTT